MTIEVRKRRGICIVDCSGRMILGGGDIALMKEFKRILEIGERRFVLNMTGLQYMDSAGVGATVACAKRAADRGGVIKIVMSPEGVVRRIFSVTCLDKAFEIFTDEDAAIASFKG